ncbi:protein containing Region of unknown function DUF1828 [Candidatus Magnetobacterium bavaricum]|uniref:Prophage protein n=1 Tax=Candidatus Magnetobacterium bavaricum TaxID=29290 RepID=A0A0F3GPD2_9BACT|nr:protein containing Region of unknown function DUF1828 [Candidatus Magnetobacterium bavaricum]
MTDEIQSLIDNYIGWLKDKTTIKNIGNDWVQITTPHLDRHNDCLQIYVKKQNGGYVLNDDGYIINDLLNSGCKFDSIKRQDLLRMSLAGFGVQRSHDVLEIHATADNFSIKKHNLIQAMLTVNDMFFLASPTIKSLFIEEVESWFDLLDIRYTPKVKFTGKSGYDNMFDFVIPKSRTAPERIVQAINRPNRDTAKEIVFRWTDTRGVRSEQSSAYALLNDHNDTIPSGVEDALNNYGVKAVRWSQRDNVRNELAA